MADRAEKMPGSERAAVLMLALGEQNAAEVLRHLQPSEVQALGSAMASMKGLERGRVEIVLDELNATLSQQAGIDTDSEDYVRKVLMNALGEERATALIDRILLGRSAKGLESLKWMEARAVAEMIGQEHPQIIAIILAHLEPDQVGDILGYMPEQIRADVIMRVATLDGIQPHALHELDEVMERQFSGNVSKFKSSKVGGVKAAANILNAMETTRENLLMASIHEVDETLGNRIQELMFVFDDLAKMEDRSMQTLLRDLPGERLVVALKGADPKLSEKIFANMSKRAADMLRDDLEVKGPVRVSEVDAAQKEILGIARKLADAGQISLGGEGEDFV